MQPNLLPDDFRLDDVAYHGDEDVYKRQHLHVTVRDLKRAECFYDQFLPLLGFDLRYKEYDCKEANAYEIIEYHHAAFSIGIVSPRSCFEKEKLSRRKPGALHHVAFMVEDTQDVYKRQEQERMYWAKQIYDILSQLQVTMATPTMSNASKPYHQLSSCFIDTVEDTLNNIYKSVDNFAQVSKYGGGMGLYFGKVRANGSDIRGFEGAAGGVIRWIKLVNDTATAVDQLGVRQGACLLYTSSV